MKRCIVLIPLILSGCTWHEIKEIEKNPLSLFQRKVEMEKGVYKGILVSKKPLGNRFICYYHYSDSTEDIVSGYSMVSETCPGGVTIERN